MLVEMIALMGAGVTVSTPCPPSVRATLTAPAAPDAPPFRLTCSLSLEPRDIVNRKLLLQGAAASGITIDCHGGRIGRRDLEFNGWAPTIAIWSHQSGTVARPRWTRPTDIKIRRCRIFGAIRIWGIGPGGDVAMQVRQSRKRNFTALAQQAAPNGIEISDSQIDAKRTVPIYLGPGTNDFTLRNSVIAGRAKVAIYLDAESANNKILNNRFLLAVEREIISVDGSAGNRIVGNWFPPLGKRGGILLYRNCGERGVIRHQTPSYNQITNNIFAAKTGQEARLVIENARSRGQRKPNYCSMDDGYPFGSSADNDGLGYNNIISGNRIATRR